MWHAFRRFRDPKWNPQKVGSTYRTSINFGLTDDDRSSKVGRVPGKLEIAIAIETAPEKDAYIRLDGESIAWSLQPDPEVATPQEGVAA